MPSVGMSVYHAYEERYEQTLQRGRMELCPDRTSDTYPDIPSVVALRIVPRWRRPECTDTVKQASQVALVKARTP